MRLDRRNRVSPASGRAKHRGQTPQPAKRINGSGRRAARCRVLALAKNPAIRHVKQDLSYTLKSMPGPSGRRDYMIGVATMCDDQIGRIPRGTLSCRPPTRDEGSRVRPGAIGPLRRRGPRHPRWRRGGTGHRPRRSRSVWPRRPCSPRAGRSCTYAASGPAVRSRGLIRADRKMPVPPKKVSMAKPTRTDAGSTPKECAGKPDLKRKG